MNTQYSDPYAFQKKKNAKSGRGELLKGYTVGSLAPGVSVKSGTTVSQMGTSYGAPTPGSDLGPRPCPSRTLRRTPTPAMILTHPNPNPSPTLHPSPQLPKITVSRRLDLAGISNRFGGKINGQKVTATDEEPKDNNAAIVFSVLSIATLFFANAPPPTP